MRRAPLQRARRERRVTIRRRPSTMNVRRVEIFGMV
jgi:hypothetical protein